MSENEPSHQLIDRIPPGRRFSAHRPALSAPADDEPVSEGDAVAIARAREVRLGKSSRMTTSCGSRLEVEASLGLSATLADLERLER